jgi:hypothetical protein
VNETYIEEVIDEMSLDEDHEFIRDKLVLLANDRSVFQEKENSVVCELQMKAKIEK